MAIDGGRRPAAPLPALDWSRPWLHALRGRGESVAAAIATGASVADALNAQATPDAPHFAPQAALPAGMAYEAFIAETGSVPTRDNLHDLFNGLVWLAEPALKRRLNALHAAELAHQGVGARRGALRDALTLFDESGALLDAPPVLVDSLRRRDWQRLFITDRALWQQARLRVVGHALLEQLATAPRKPLVAFVLATDPLLLDEASWAAKPFLPLPVLGVPGWCQPNHDPAFYDDAAVFRPPKAGRVPLPCAGSTRVQA